MLVAANESKTAEENVSRHLPSLTKENVVQSTVQYFFPQFTVLAISVQDSLLTDHASCKVKIALQVHQLDVLLLWIISTLDRLMWVRILIMRSGVIELLLVISIVAVGLVIPHVTHLVAVGITSVCLMLSCLQMWV